MSKELEALDGLFDLVTCQGSFEKAQKYFYIIEEALQHLESIDNAKPNEALVDLDIIESELWDSDFHYQKYSKELDNVKNYILKLQEQEKVLEIIKKKRVNVDLFWNDFIDNGFGYHYYLEKWYKYQNTDKQKLTEEEFELLKRYFAS